MGQEPRFDDREQGEAMARLACPGVAQGTAPCSEIPYLNAVVCLADWVLFLVQA
jgi:hypothetical protein